MGLGGAATTWPMTARAQQSDQVRRIGVLMNGAAIGAEYHSYLAAFIQHLQQLEWTDGRNLHIDVRWNASDAVLAQTYAVELIGLTPDVILAASTINLIPVAQVTRTVPVVFVSVADPVAQGFVASVRQPGGNLTGFSLFEFSLGGKWLDLMKQVAPSLTRVAMIFNPDTAPYSKFFVEVIEAAAPSLGVQAIAVPVQTSTHVEPALASFARQPNGALITWGTDLSPLAVDVAQRYGLPSISPDGNIAKDGGLIEYGPSIDLPRHFRQAATYVDRILKGERPADLPIHQVLAGHQPQDRQSTWPHHPGDAVGHGG